MITRKGVWWASFGGSFFGESNRRFGCIRALGGGRLLRIVTLGKERVQKQRAVGR